LYSNLILNYILRESQGRRRKPVRQAVFPEMHDHYFKIRRGFKDFSLKKRKTVMSMKKEGVTNKGQLLRASTIG